MHKFALKLSWYSSGTPTVTKTKSIFGIAILLLVDN